MKNLYYLPILLILFLPYQSQALIEISRITNASTHGCDGAVEITATGNAGPFTISWGASPNQSVGGINGSHTIEHLCSNTPYSITVTNQFGCNFILSTTLGNCNDYTGPGPVVLLQKLTNASYPGEKDGSIQVTVSPGNNPVLYYRWTDVAGNVVSTDKNLAHADAGTYCLETSDGCQVVTSCFVIKDCSCPCPMEVEFSLNLHCGAGANTGSLTAIPVPDFPPYTFQWTGPNGFTASGQSISSIGEGEYFVTITDNCGRTVSKSQKTKCCNSYELPDLTSAYECFGWEDFLGIWHERDGHLELNLPLTIIGDPACNSAFTIQWSSDNSTNTVTFNPATNNWDGTTVKAITEPGNYCVTVTNSCGCTRKSCRSFGPLGNYSGFDFVFLDQFLLQNVPGYNWSNTYGAPFFPVLNRCYQCAACGMDGQTNVVGGDCDTNGGGFDLFSYTDPNPYDEQPCNGGTISCYNNPPNLLSPWTIPTGLEGIEIVDKNSPPQTIVIEGITYCVYPAWCLFAPGNIDNFPVRFPVLAKHPVGKLIPADSGACTPPPGDVDCVEGGFLMNDGVGRDCILRWYCSNDPSVVVREDDIYQSQIVICKCAIWESNCTTVLRCELNYEEKGDPSLCSGYEILHYDCNNDYPFCQQGPFPVTTPGDENVTQPSDRAAVPESPNQPVFGLRVYPNPTNGNIRIDFEQSNMNPDRRASIAIFDLSGRKLIQQDASLTTSFSHLDLSFTQMNLPAGTYILSVTNGEGPAARFLIIHMP